MRDKKLFSWTKGWWRKALFVFIAIGLVALLVGCGTVTYDVTFYSGQRWKAKVDMMLTPQQLAMAGGKGGIEAELERRRSQHEQQGVQYKMEEREEEGNTVYRLSVEGEGWDTLEQVVFSDQAGIMSGSGEGEVVFDYYPISMDVINLSLTGGQILSSNADRVEGSTATWYNLTTEAQAVLVEAVPSPLSNFHIDIPTGVIIGLGGAVLIALLFLFISKQSKQLA